MKKITLLSFALLAGLISFSQQRGTGNARTMSFEEANRLNGQANPTINGKPYSQYKAEQEALKAKQQSPAKVVTPSGLILAKDAGTPAPVTASPAVLSAPTAEKQPASLQVTPVIGKPDSNTEKPKEQPVQTEKPKG